jgi:GxxExxY protein
MNIFLHSDLTDKILGCAVAVHRELGPGLSEYSYQSALALEMSAKPLNFVREPALTVRFRDTVIGWHRPDFIVEDLVVVELKAVARFEPVFTKQMLTYLKVTGLNVGLLLNFNVPSMANDGIKRVAL